VKVILLKDIDNLGSVGDELKVKDGYARNFLLPQNFAVEATKGTVQLVEKKKKEKQTRENKIKNECTAIAEKIAAVSCTIPVEAGEEDKIFGSVTSEMIMDVLKVEGIEFDKRKIVMDEVIKKLGVYNLDVKLHPEVTAQLKVWVVKK